MYAFLHWLAWVLPYASAGVSIGMLTVMIILLLRTRS